MASQGCSTPAFFWLNGAHGPHQLAFFANSDATNRERSARRSFLLPSGIGTTRDEMDTSAETLKEI